MCGLNSVSDVGADVCMCCSVRVYVTDKEILFGCEYRGQGPAEENRFTQNIFRFLFRLLYGALQLLRLRLLQRLAWDIQCIVHQHKVVFSCSTPRADIKVVVATALICGRLHHRLGIGNCTRVNNTSSQGE